MKISRKKHGSSKFKGVVFNRDTGKWMARITVNYIALHLGSFEKEEDAAIAYDAVAVKYFGKFAKTNSQGGIS